MPATLPIDQLREKLEALFETPDAFKAWLDRHAKDDVVGKTNVEYSCPLATFARDKGISLNVERDHFELYCDADGDYDSFVPEPEWAMRFVAEIDQYGGYEPNSTSWTAIQAPVTARQAKDALTRALS